MGKQTFGLYTLECKKIGCPATRRVDDIKKSRYCVGKSDGIKTAGLKCLYANFHITNLKYWPASAILTSVVE